MRAAERRRRRSIAVAWASAITVAIVITAGGAWLIPRDTESSKAAAPAIIESTPAPVAEVPSESVAPTPQEANPKEEQPIAETRPIEPQTPKPPKAVTQRVSVGIGAYGYEPAVITVKAGSAVELTVAQGDGCASGFLIPELGVAADNSTQAAVVVLPSVEPGIYRFTCGMEMVEGRLVVE